MSHSYHKVLNHIANLTKQDPQIFRRHLNDPEDKNKLGEFDQLMERQTPPSLDGLIQLESIVMHKGRPVFFVKADTITEMESELWKTRLTPKLDGISANICKVGRIEVEGHPGQAFLNENEEFYAGTCCVIGKSLLLTNRHVALEFCNRNGVVKSGLKPRVDFVEELQKDPDKEIEIIKAVYISDQEDFAVLKVSGQLPEPVAFVTEDLSEPLSGGDNLVYIIGYPAFDTRNPTEIQHEIFDGKYNVKRLAPGRIRNVRKFHSPHGQMRTELASDYTSLGGNSGSPVFELNTGKLIGLHYKGSYAEANYSIPAWSLVNILNKLIAEFDRDPAPEDSSAFDHEMFHHFIHLSFENAQRHLWEQRYEKKNHLQPLICVMVLSFFGDQHQAMAWASKHLNSNSANQLMICLRDIADAYYHIWRSLNRGTPFPPLGDYSIYSTCTDAGKPELLNQNGRITTLFKNLVGIRRVE